MATKRRFLVVYEVGENNLSGFVPDVRGVVATAATLEEIRKTMREAVEFHFEGMVADGNLIPEPATTSVDFAGEDPKHGVSSCIVEWLEVTVPMATRRKDAMEGANSGPYTREQLMAWFREHKGDRMDKELATELGIHPSSISKIFHGKHDPGEALLHALGWRKVIMYERK